MSTWTFQGKRYECPIVLALERLSGRWKTSILWLLHDGTCRFNAICRALPEVNRGVVLRQLRSLEEDGLVSRGETEVGGLRRVEYRLTERCDAMVPALMALLEWGQRYGQREE